MTYLSLTDSLSAEAAFYAAFERRDLEAMMFAWDDTDDVVCVHPMGASLQGVDAVRESWQLLFANDEPMRFTPHLIHRYETDNLSVHHLYEQIAYGPRFEDESVVIATNTYRLTESGWRMIMHHGSPGRQPSMREARPPRAVH